MMKVLVWALVLKSVQGQVFGVERCGDITTDTTWEDSTMTC